MFFLSTFMLLVLLSTFMLLVLVGGQVSVARAGRSAQRVILKAQLLLLLVLCAVCQSSSLYPETLISTMGAVGVARKMHSTTLWVTPGTAA